MALSTHTQNREGETHCRGKKREQERGEREREGMGRGDREREGMGERREERGKREREGIGERREGKRGEERGRKTGERGAGGTADERKRIQINLEPRCGLGG